MYIPHPDDPDPDDVQRWAQLRSEGIETWHDLVRRYIPGLSDRAAEYVLWEHTPYPLSTVWAVERRLRRIAWEIEERRARG